MKAFDKKQGYLICLYFLCSPFIFGQKYEVEVALTIENKEIYLDDNFQVYIIIEDSIVKQIIKPKIFQNRFMMPAFEDSQRGLVALKYKNHTIGINDVYLDFNQNMKWVFGVDNRPFLPESYVGETPVECHELLYFLKYEPQEFGIGTQAIMFIPNKRIFKKRLREIISY